MPRQLIDKTNMKFGMLTVLSYAGKTASNEILWKCRCDCGKEIIRRSSTLKPGVNSSCGCASNSFKAESVGKAARNRAAERKKQKEQDGYRDSLCWHCIRSAAPPSLQCIRDKTRGKELPEGVVCREEILITGMNVIVLKCPDFLDIAVKENAALLKQARGKNIFAPAKRHDVIVPGPGSIGQSINGWWKT